jgi:type VI secretion system secreted protein Hcp
MILIRKQVDSTSPSFAHAFASNETFEQMVIKFVPTTSTAGMPPAIFTVRLTNASIGVYRHMFGETPTARYVGFQLLEEISFYYQKIEWGFNEHYSAEMQWAPGA